MRAVRRAAQTAAKHTGGREVDRFPARCVLSRHFSSKPISCVLSSLPIGDFQMQPPRRQLLSRPMGNAQSRQTALGQAPQYGATTNPNGAQTASRMTIGGQPVQRVDPSQDQFSPEFQLDYQSPAMYDARAIGQRSRASQPDQSPAAATQQPVPATAPYAGGDVADCGCVAETRLDLDSTWRCGDPDAAEVSEKTSTKN